ncbi:MAG: Twin-arginine translocation protein TatC [uncultured Solirubrobacteraceae bacterium]|uniref:Sec-independent protein translocase protein TatC n=1 Tax=uncultured Solirubrobacteraceae bacterium TaxID=1162706 RepID=A0A6J4RHG6_9ACTN|nr:MAG: Twin-arginine translocation protein TatC [uncultured Solirubrobacteraceae bacterium]
MATAIRRPVSHEDRLSLTEHLDELRSRLIISVLILLGCFAFTFWQNETILKLVNEPLQQTQNLEGDKRSNDPLEQNARFQRQTAQAFRAEARSFQQQQRLYSELALAADGAAERRAYQAAARAAGAAATVTARAADAEPVNKGRLPVTLGVAEPFTTTVSVAFYGALLLAFPFLLFQAYSFILPAFAPGERKVALPLMMMFPVLFISGVAFGYFVVLPRAIDFLQNFNDDDFDILIQAKDYYKFAVMFVGSIGLLFQIPIVVIAVTRLGIVTPRQLQKNWGYVLLGLAVLAAVATPTPDPITMLLAMVPLFLLFEASILVSAWLNKVRPPGSLWGEDFDEFDEPVEDDEPEADDDLSLKPFENDHQD